MATSVTVRAIGPAVSWLCPMGMIPSCEMSPSVGLRPAIRLLPDGHTTEPSVPVPTGAALVVPASGDGQGTRVGLDDGAEERVQHGDALQVAQGQVAARQLAGSHESLELGDRRLDPWTVGGLPRGGG